MFSEFLRAEFLPFVRESQALRAWLPFPLYFPPSLTYKGFIQKPPPDLFSLTFGEGVPCLQGSFPPPLSRKRVMTTIVQTSRPTFFFSKGGAISARLPPKFCSPPCTMLAPYHALRYLTARVLVGSRRRNFSLFCQKSYHDRAFLVIFRLTFFASRLESSLFLEFHPL